MKRLRHYSGFAALARLWRFAAAPCALGLAAAALVIAANPWGMILPLREAAQSEDGSYSGALRRASPAVVNIAARRAPQLRHPLLSHPWLRPARPRPAALGSGVILNDSGHIVTANHVIQGADQIVVQLSDGRQLQAELIGSDWRTDLALLSIEADGLQEIAVGDPDAVEVGDVVFAIGNPVGLGQTVTRGIISSRDRLVPGLRSHDRFLQTDAAINSGNSGGALVDARGNLLGINLARVVANDSVGIGFAIPVDIVGQVAADLARHGEVRRGWLGMDVRPQGGGLLVIGLAPGGPAHLAGVRVGDHLVGAAGAGRMERVDQLWRIISSTPPGELIELHLIRGGSEMRIQARAIQEPDAGSGLRV